MSAEDTTAADVTATGPSGYVEYEINVEMVLRAELPGVLADIDVAPLTVKAIAAIPPKAKGAYVLYEDGFPVYAGKTDTRHGFRDRLSRHFETIQHRHGFDDSRIGFKVVRIMVFSNFDVEAILIDELQEQDANALAWNNSGFGSNDPGHRREGQEPAAFDIARPLNIDRPLPFVNPGPTTVLDLLLNLKNNLPYYFRFQTDVEGTKSANYRKGHVDFRNAPQIAVPAGKHSFRELLLLVLKALPKGWRATVFDGRVILYKERNKYTYAKEYLTA